MLQAPPPTNPSPFQTRLQSHPSSITAVFLSLMSALTSHSQLSPRGPCSVLSPFHIPDVFLLYSLSSCLRRKRPEGMMFFVFPVLHSILYPKNLETFSAHCKHSINTCGMNERMNEFQSVSADEAIFNARQSSAAIWCQKLELQV